MPSITITHFGHFDDFIRSDPKPREVLVYTDWAGVQHTQVGSDVTHKEFLAEFPEKEEEAVGA